MRFKKSMMKVVGLMLLVLLAAVCSPAMAKDESPKAEESSSTQQKLIKVSTLESVEANQEFQKNVQIMQSQRQRVIQLQNQLEQTQTKGLKKSLKKEIAAAMKKLNKDNKKMAETYGFSLNRNYVLVVEKAHIYMSVSDEEATKIELEKKK
jgi:hypothetical protein